MTTIDSKLTEKKPLVNFGNIEFGSWELDRTDPLSPAYETPFERGINRLLETFHYIWDVYFGNFKEPPNRKDYDLF